MTYSCNCNASLIVWPPDHFAVTPLPNYVDDTIFCTTVDCVQTATDECLPYLQCAKNNELNFSKMKNELY